MAETNKKITSLGAAPGKVKQLQKEAFAASGAPETMHQDARGLEAAFRDRPAGELKAYLDEVGVPLGQFRRAVEADAPIVVDTVDLGVYLSRDGALPEVGELTQSSPAAPTVGTVADTLSAEEEMASAYRAVRESNEALPEAFAELRDDLREAGLDASDAQDSAYSFYVFGKVAGKRLDLSPEQVLGLDAVQRTVESNLSQAREIGRAVDAESTHSVDQGNTRESKSDADIAPDGSTDAGDPHKAESEVTTDLSGMDDHAAEMLAEEKISKYDFTSEIDTTYFWSGLGGHGEFIAAGIAQRNMGVTLETFAKSKGIDLPPFDFDDPFSRHIWEKASRAYAQGASGIARVVLGKVINEKSFWNRIEFPELIKNKKMTAIYAVDPGSEIETELWRR